MKLINIFKLFLVLVISTALFIGCDEDSDSPESNPMAEVKVVHASPDAPAVDLLVDNNIAGSGLAFPNNTGYLQVDAGTRNVKVNVSGTSTTVIEADLPIEESKYYSVFAIDAVANISALVIEDDLTAPASGNAHVRFIHLSPDAPAVDVVTASGSALFPDYMFKEYSAFTPVAAGSYDLKVNLAGTTTTVLDLPGIMLESGKIYTVFAKGFVTGSGDQALGAQIIANN